MQYQNFFLFSCYLLISEHLVKIVWRYDARLQCFDEIYFVRFFLDHPVYNEMFDCRIFLAVWMQN